MCKRDKALCKIVQIHKTRKESALLSSSIQGTLLS